MNLDDLQHSVIRLAERGAIPDSLIRWGIRRMCEQRLRSDTPEDAEARQRLTERFLAGMRRAPIAPVPEKANEQHYEVPPAFFEHVLGKHLKYSCCFWPDGVGDLDGAEAAALAQTCERAGIADGMRILELGCGWGSLTLWMAERYPGSSITAVSNSHAQRQHILGRAAERGLGNVRVITADMNDLALDERFDRVVSVEMFEHMRNYERLLARIAGWLAPDGRLFVHIFCHRAVPYEFGSDGAGNWMGRYFFSGGIMPSDDLLLRCQRDLALCQQWRWQGTHYQRTAEAWLANLDGRREAVLDVLVRAYGTDAARLWLGRWRIFFLACAELFGFRNGREWWVSHYLFEPRAADGRAVRTARTAGP